MIDGNHWPSAQAFLDVSRVGQLSDGRARCTALAVCDEDGRPTRTFRQGEAAHFFYEFEIQDEIGVPCSRLEFRMATRIVLIHGKNTFQYGVPVPQSVRPPARLRFHHRVVLELAPGTYAFALGLSSTDEASYTSYRDHTISDETLEHSLTEHCRLVIAGSFEVQLGPGGRLSHLGCTNLPGTCHVNEVAPPLTEPARTCVPDEGHAADPAVFHVTHWKAGSQWIHRILRACVPERIVRPQERQAQFLDWPLRSGKVYPTVYVSRQEFESVRLPANWRRFVVIRDLRDTLVSGYFSLKVSHPTHDPFMAQWRARLHPLDVEDALILLMDEWLRASVSIQTSWADAGEPVIRYEDLLDRDVEILETVLLDQCQLPTSRAKLREAVLANRFQQISGGRPRGCEDEAAHARKGIAGDWRNYFTDRVRRAFKTRFGGLLVATGYEQDLNW